MTIHKIAVPTTATTLYALLGAPQLVDSVSIMADDSNAATVYVGTDTSVPLPIYAGQTKTFSSTKDTAHLIISGTSGDYIIVVLN